MDRFSKSTLAAYVQKQLDDIQNDWGFNPRSGTVQIVPIAKDRLQTNPIDHSEVVTCADGDEDQYTVHKCYQAYAEYEALIKMADHFGLVVTEVPENFKPTKIRAPRGTLTRFRPEAQ